MDLISPAGWISVVAGEKGIKKISFLKGNDHPPDFFPPQNSGKILNRARRWFEDDYWGKTNKPFPWDLIDCSSSTPFQKKVLKLLWEIPFGEVVSYEGLAKKMGIKKGGAQAIGQVNKRNPMPIIIPCHRVISADGSLGGYAPGLSYKKKLLEHEGVSPAGLTDISFMREALREAKKAERKGEIPIGALLVREGKIISKGYNRRESSRNPLKHAEIIVLEKAAKDLNNWRLSESTLYATLEPCPMCLGALLQARVGRLVFGCADPKRSVGAGLRPAPTIATYAFPSMEKIHRLTGNNHTLEILGSVLEKECSEILRKFFMEKRK